MKSKKSVLKSIFLPIVFTIILVFYYAFGLFIENNLIESLEIKVAFDMTLTYSFMLLLALDALLFLSALKNTLFKKARIIYLVLFTSITFISVIYFVILIDNLFIYNNDVKDIIILLCNYSETLSSNIKFDLLNIVIIVNMCLFAIVVFHIVVYVIVKLSLKLLYNVKIIVNKIYIYYLDVKQSLKNISLGFLYKALS